MPDLAVVFATLPQYLATAAVLILAQVVYLVFGFGAGLMALGLLVLVLPGPQDIVVILLLVSLPVELAIILSHRKEIRWQQISLVVAGIVIGVPIGTFLLTRGDPRAVLTVLVVLLALVGLAFLVHPRRVRVRWPRWSAAPVGMLSGLLFGLLGSGGPPVVFFYQLQGLDKTTFRNHLIAIFFLVSVIRIVSYSVSGLITSPRLVSALAVLPAVFFGAWLGNRIHLGLPPFMFRRLLGALFLILGLSLLLR